MTNPHSNQDEQRLTCTNIDCAMVSNGDEEICFACGSELKRGKWVFVDAPQPANTLPSDKRQPRINKERRSDSPSTNKKDKTSTPVEG